MRRYDTISLLTDFGTDDEFVGVMKSVVRDLAPHVTTVDLTHNIQAFDVRAGSLALARSTAYLPEGVVVAVVDPGVGTERRPIAVEVAGGLGVFVGPDNGLLAPAVAIAGGADRAVELNNPEYHLDAPGATFAGRDVFTPAAAYLCNGIPFEQLGDPVDTALLMPGAIPLPRWDADVLVAQVLWIDRFGNCQLNVGPDDVPNEWGERLSVSYGTPDTGGPHHRSARRVSAYGHLSTGEVGLVLDSTGMLSVSLDRRSAAEELRIAPNDQVTLAMPSDAGGDTGDDAGDARSGAEPTPVELQPRSSEGPA